MKRPAVIVGVAVLVLAVAAAAFLAGRGTGHTTAASTTPAASHGTTTTLPDERPCCTPTDNANSGCMGCPGNNATTTTTTTTTPGGSGSVWQGGAVACTYGVTCRPHIGGTVTLRDSSGAALAVTLAQVTDPDTVDATGGYDACPQTGFRLVLVRLSLANVGTSILAGEVGTDVSLVTKAGADYVSYGSCDWGPATYLSGQATGQPNIATPTCSASLTSPNLPPGGSATVCRVTEIPTTATVAEIELRQPMSFTSAAVWYLAPAA
jgi:hypothetical protein